MTGARVDLSQIARDICRACQASNPQRSATFSIAHGVFAEGDEVLLRRALHILIGNAWTCSARRPHTDIEFGISTEDGTPNYYVLDRNPGLDSTYVAQLMAAFERVHVNNEESEIGLGLGTVQRIIKQHGGRLWARSEIGLGTAVRFSIDYKSGLH
jgi:light-regulated signal transduction histidine kinase (bacteriophytochrome)